MCSHTQTTSNWCPTHWVTSCAATPRPHPTGVQHIGSHHVQPHPDHIQLVSNTLGHIMCSHTQTTSNWCPTHWVTSCAVTPRPHPTGVQHIGSHHPQPQRDHVQQLVHDNFCPTHWVTSCTTTPTACPTHWVTSCTTTPTACPTHWVTSCTTTLTACPTHRVSSSATTQSIHPTPVHHNGSHPVHPQWDQVQPPPPTPPTPSNTRSHPTQTLSSNPSLPKRHPPTLAHTHTSRTICLKNQCLLSLWQTGSEINKLHVRIPQGVSSIFSA